MSYSIIGLEKDAAQIGESGISIQKESLGWKAVTKKRAKDLWCYLTNNTIWNGYAWNQLVKKEHLVKRSIISQEYQYKDIQLIEYGISNKISNEIVASHQFEPKVVLPAKGGTYTFNFLVQYLQSTILTYNNGQTEITDWEQKTYEYNEDVSLDNLTNNITPETFIKNINVSVPFTDLFESVIKVYQEENKIESIEYGFPIVDVENTLTPGDSAAVINCFVDDIITYTSGIKNTKSGEAVWKLARTSHSNFIQATGLDYHDNGTKLYHVTKGEILGTDTADIEIYNKNNLGLYTTKSVSVTNKLKQLVLTDTSCAGTLNNFVINIPAYSCALHIESGSSPKDASAQIYYTSETSKSIIATYVGIKQWMMQIADDTLSLDQNNQLDVWLTAQSLETTQTPQVTGGIRRIAEFSYTQQGETVTAIYATGATLIREANVLTNNFEIETDPGSITCPELSANENTVMLRNNRDASITNVYRLYSSKARQNVNISTYGTFTIDYQFKSSEYSKIYRVQQNSSQCYITARSRFDEYNTSSLYLGSIIRFAQITYTVKSNYGGQVITVEKECASSCYQAPNIITNINIDHYASGISFDHNQYGYTSGRIPSINTTVNLVLASGYIIRTSSKDWKNINYNRSFSLQGGNSFLWNFDSSSGRIYPYVENQETDSKSITITCEYQVIAELSSTGTYKDNPTKVFIANNLSIDISVIQLAPPSITINGIKDKSSKLILGLNTSTISPTFDIYKLEQYIFTANDVIPNKDSITLWDPQIYTGGAIVTVSSSTYIVLYKIQTNSDGSYSAYGISAPTLWYPNTDITITANEYA